MEIDPVGESKTREKRRVNYDRERSPCVPAICFEEEKPSVRNALFLVCFFFRSKILRKIERKTKKKKQKNKKMYFHTG